MAHGDVSLREERDSLAAELAGIDAAVARGLKHPRGYLAEFYRQQIAELDKLIAGE